MRPSNRRDVLRLGALFALAPLWIAPVRAQGSSYRSLVIPAGAFRLTRVLARPLGDSARLSVERSWAIRFHPESEGARVEGEQLAVTVDAPPALAPLADLERSREVTGFLPARLDPHGRMRQDTPPAPSPPLDAAVAAGTRLLAAASLSAAEREDAKRFLARIGATASELVSTVPADLFFPAPGTVTSAQPLPPVGGVAAGVDIVITAEADPATGRLIAYDRRIDTRVGESRRSSLERWTLEPIERQ